MESEIASFWNEVSPQTIFAKPLFGAETYIGILCKRRFADNLELPYNKIVFIP